MLTLLVAMGTTYHLGGMYMRLSVSVKGNRLQLTYLTDFLGEMEKVLTYPDLRLPSSRPPLTQLLEFTKLNQSISLSLS